MNANGSLVWTREMPNGNYKVETVWDRRVRGALNEARKRLRLPATYGLKKRDADKLCAEVRKACEGCKDY